MTTDIIPVNGAVATARQRKRRVDWQQVERICGTCGTTFWLRPAVVKAINYCSRPCSARAQAGVPKRPEAVARQRAAVTGRPNPTTTVTNRQRVADLHPKWAGASPAKITGRHRAERYFPAEPCAICGEIPIHGQMNIHRHHVDCNTSNNTRENIVFLCRAHHAEAHREIKRRGATA